MNKLNLSSAKVEKIWITIEKLKESAINNQKNQQSKEGKMYCQGVARGLQYSLNWIDYYLKR